MRRIESIDVRSTRFGRSTQVVVAGVGLLASGAMVVGCGSDGNANGEGGIRVEAKGSALDQLVKHPRAVVVAPHEARFAGVARPNEVPKINPDSVISKIGRGFEHQNGVRLRVGKVYLLDAHTDVEQASSDDDFGPDPEELKNSYACDVHTIEDMDPVNARIVALSIDKEGQPQDFTQIIWQRNVSNGEVGKHFAVCFAEKNEPSVGVAVAVVRITPSESLQDYTVSTNVEWPVLTTAPPETTPVQ